MIKQNRRILTWLALVFLLIIVIILPVKLPFNINVKGKVFPEKEWLLIKGPDGRLLTSLINHDKGMHENYSVAQFERGDAVQFSLSNELTSGSMVSSLDTIGMIYSNKTEKELIDLRTALANESARLKVNLSEEKEAVVKSEEQKLEYAKKQLEEQQKLYVRQKSLYEKNLISQEEFDVAQGAVDLFTINVEIARERLKTVTTGVKGEEIDFIKSRIEGLQKQISILEKKFSDFVIKSPISGEIKRVLSTDTLLIVADNQSQIIISPVQFSDLKYLRTDQQVMVEDIAGEHKVEGKLVNIDNALQTSGQTQFFLITIKVENAGQDFHPGQIVSADIICDPKYPREYLSDFINSLFY